MFIFIYNTTQNNDSSYLLAARNVIRSLHPCTISLVSLYVTKKILLTLLNK